MARRVLALDFRKVIASYRANPGRAIACASGLDEGRLIDISNDESAKDSSECNIAIGRCMSAKNSNCVEHCAPIGAYKGVLGASCSRGCCMCCDLCRYAG